MGAMSVIVTTVTAHKAGHCRNTSSEVGMLGIDSSVQDSDANPLAT
jgi:hypothetical protein